MVDPISAKGDDAIELLGGNEADKTFEKRSSRRGIRSSEAKLAAMTDRVLSSYSRVGWCCAGMMLCQTLPAAAAGTEGPLLMGACSVVSLLAFVGWWKWARLARATKPLEQPEKNRSPQDSQRPGNTESIATARLSLTEEVASAFTSATTRQEAFDNLVALVHRVTRARSVAVFAPVDGRLVPVSHRSPSDKLGRNFDILELGEKCVHELWPDKKAIGSGGSEQERYFPGERQALAYHLPDLGVLYLGHHDPEGLSAETRSLMPVIVAQTCLGLSAVAGREGEVMALRTKAEVLAKLEGWVSRSELLHEETVRLGSLLDFEELMQGVFKLLKSLYPECQVHLGCDPNFAASSHEETDFKVPQNEVCEWARTLNLREAAEQKYPGLVRLESLLAVPVMHGERAVGALLVGSQVQKAFNEVDLQVLQSLAGVCHSALERSRLHLSTVDALEKLRDSEAQLVQSTKLAAVGVLAAGIAHELNTPLGTVKLGLDFATKNLPQNPEKTLKMVEMATSGLTKSQEIVNKLLYYCREGNLEEQIFDVKDVVEDAVSFLKHHLEQDKIDLRTDLAPGLSVLGNKNEIQQVLSNLVMNARDAILLGDYERGIWLEASLQEDQVRVEVRDLGPGVKEEVAQKMFDPFYTTKAVGEGTGLGLSISQQIVAKHQGSLELVPSEVGATFRLTLPRAEGE